MKKRSEEMQTLHAGCSKAEPKKIHPTADPFPGARDGQNLISWSWSLPLPTNPVWWGSMHAILSNRGNRPTHRQDRLQYTVPQLVCSVIITIHCSVLPCLALSRKIAVKWASLSCNPQFPRAPCGLRGCENGPAPFPGRMSYKATKPGLISV